MKKYKAVYWNLPHSLDHEKNLIREWQVDDLELIAVNDAGICNDPEAFVRIAGDAEAVVVDGFDIDRGMMEKLEKTKIIALHSIGFNNVDLKAATDHGICVCNTPGYCTEEVAIHTIGLILDCARQITLLDRRVRQGKWSSELEGLPERLSNKTIGLVFFGSIAQAMVPVLKSMGMKIICYAPSKSAEYLDRAGVDKCESLDDLLRASDIVSLHAPLIAGVTEHMIGESQLKTMKKSAYLINTARGGIVDEKALARALKEGWIKGAAVDVIEDEVNFKSELFDLDSCVITPHVAYLSDDAVITMKTMTLHQLVDRLVSGRLPGELLNKDVANRLKP